ncbi:bis(5'-nucleosyl)-tetraphosphatase (symmetrical) YqeK [Phormidium sp. FACHB-1136]|uniref:bis(5'-nucleosyl)-tetraphosphatase (symmetrical) YqeK n=1 Tax=Phormidium sp. FACHB-1136 TaxID=2692848 RepID=UPI00168A3152|nr:bis(5'-nucleosyl)-tetraphosphatase (symmetrical) YqeK [Phormidium sp. FACHB-1136]MBD2427219.1 bis(5'-nucleosyl)-tetraphosphatase (symmetrical) YqeK [Phormidium sp. FACHB-1136]
MPKPRLAHSLRVEAMAVDLAQHHGLDPVKAAQAGLMHDLAKYFPAEKLLSMAQQAGLDIDPVDEVNPHLLHADVSALVAQQDLGVTDPEVLAAIANHTLGRPAMSPLSCVVFLADTLEPGRGKGDDLKRLRRLSYRNLPQAVYQTCDYTFAHLMEKAKPIHPRALHTRNWFLAHHRSQP